MSILKARLLRSRPTNVMRSRPLIGAPRLGQEIVLKRSEPITIPQSRITDHRINFSAHQLAAILDGEIDAFIEELTTEDEANRLAEAGFDEN